MGASLAAALTAGLSAGIGVFAVGFALGTIRVILLVPRLGEMAAVLIELPIMLIASWFVASWIMRRFEIAALPPAALMGLVAFSILILLEIALERFAFGGSIRSFAGKISHGPGLAGFLGQILFGLMPIIAVFARR
jgi:hypothetical protein